ncbi:hypothetical protein OA86_08170 [Kaistella jeonii]|uniref:Uncharacterized protein n=1 Tax=Kaistella jeonii TaxID=266749 RepID=A0A0C1CXE3_9FLAO|nr:hypothetical protein OA86_08170 [Kaistella jeonii]
MIFERCKSTEIKWLYFLLFFGRLFPPSIPAIFIFPEKIEMSSIQVGAEIFANKTVFVAKRNYRCKVS